jgi:hypothetical protein
MTENLADLDRRAALAMGMEIDPWPTIPGTWYKAPHLRIKMRTFRPTTDANDCREFVQWAVSHGDGFDFELHVGRRAADCTFGDNWEHYGVGGASKTKHGPTYDLVAQVLALLAALEKES